MTAEVIAVPCRLLNVKKVAAKLDRSTRWVWQAVADDEFPVPLKLGGRGARWIESEVDTWISRLAESRESAGRGR